jgi:hypothetical protein
VRWCYGMAGAVRWLTHHLTSHLTSHLTYHLTYRPSHVHTPDTYLTHTSHVTSHTSLQHLLSAPPHCTSFLAPPLCISSVHLLCAPPHCIASLHRLPGTSSLHLLIAPPHCTPSLRLLAATPHRTRVAGEARGVGTAEGGKA